MSKTKDPAAILEAAPNPLYTMLCSILSDNLVSYRHVSEGDNSLAAGTILSAICDLHGNGWTVEEIDALVAYCHREIREQLEARKRGVN